MSTIIQAQGFENQLDQYEVHHAIGEGSCNPVWFGCHRITGIKVAIKVMESAKYIRMTKENGISEGDAMELC